MLFTGSVHLPNRQKINSAHLSDINDVLSHSIRMDKESLIVLMKCVVLEANYLLTSNLACDSIFFYPTASSKMRYVGHFLQIPPHIFSKFRKILKWKTSKISHIELQFLPYKSVYPTCIDPLSV